MSLKEKARHLRTTQTDAERKLWFYLRNRQLGGIKFRRQVPIARYIVDFFAFDLGLIIELDGGHHLEQSGYDARRTLDLEALGYKVLRFWNHDVLKCIDDVLQKIVNLVGKNQ